MPILEVGVQGGVDTSFLICILGVQMKDQLIGVVADKIMPDITCPLLSQSLMGNTSKARLTVKSNSKRVRNIGSSRNVLGVRQARPLSELLGSEAIRARQIAAVAKQHDHFLGMSGPTFKYYIK